MKFFEKVDKDIRKLNDCPLTGEFWDLITLGELEPQQDLISDYLRLIPSLSLTHLRRFLSMVFFYGILIDVTRDELIGIGLLGRLLEEPENYRGLNFDLLEDDLKTIFIICCLEEERRDELIDYNRIGIINTKYDIRITQKGRNEKRGIGYLLYHLDEIDIKGFLANTDIDFAYEEFKAVTKYLIKNVSRSSMI